MSGRRAASDRERIHASLIGGAMGDALGAAIEFEPLETIRRRLGPNGPAEPAPAYGMAVPITDDTQMTLFTGEGLLDALEDDAAGRDPVKAVHAALLRWCHTQAGPPHGIAEGALGLAADPRLNRACAPGVTVMSALRAAARTGTAALGRPAVNDSKGCGTIARVAPVAFAVDRERVFDLAIATSALTHGHATGQLAAAAFAELLADVAAGADVEATARVLADAYGTLANGDETAAAIRAALDAPRDGKPETVEALGGGWVAEEALAIALYAALAAPDPETALRIAVLHSGDSDSTGAVAGNLVGLLHPAETLAHPWAARVEAADRVDALAARLAALRDRREPPSPAQRRG